MWEVGDPETRIGLLLGFCLVTAALADFADFAHDAAQARKAASSADLRSLRSEVPPPLCPAPGSAEADSYVESGGADNALLWYLALRGLSDHDDYHESAATDHGAGGRPTVRTAVTSSSATSMGDRTRASEPSAPRVSSSVLKPAQILRADKPLPSPSYGYKPSSSVPASTSFRPSSGGGSSGASGARGR